MTQTTLDIVKAELGYGWRSTNARLDLAAAAAPVFSFPYINKNRD